MSGASVSRNLPGSNSRGGYDTPVPSLPALRSPVRMPQATPLPRVVPGNNGGSERSLSEQIESYNKEKQDFQLWLNNLPPVVSELAGMGSAAGAIYQDLVFYGTLGLTELDPHLHRKFSNKPKEWSTWVEKNFGGWKDHRDPRANYYRSLRDNPPTYTEGNSLEAVAQNNASLARIKDAIGISFAFSTARALRDTPADEIPGKVSAALWRHVTDPLKDGENPNMGFAVATSLLNVSDLIPLIGGGKGLAKLAVKGASIGGKSAKVVLREVDTLLARGTKMLTSKETQNSSALKNAMKEMITASTGEDAGLIQRRMGQLREALGMNTAPAKVIKASTITQKKGVVPSKGKIAANSTLAEPLMPNEAVAKTARYAQSASKARAPTKSPTTQSSNNPLSRFIPDSELSGSKAGNSNPPVPPVPPDTARKTPVQQPRSIEGESPKDFPDFGATQSAPAVAAKKKTPSKITSKAGAGVVADKLVESLRENFGIPYRAGNTVNSRTMKELKGLINQTAARGNVSAEQMLSMWKKLDPAQQAVSLGEAVLRAREGLNGLGATEVSNLRKAIDAQLKALPEAERMPFVKSLMGEGWKDFYQANRGGRGAGGAAPAYAGAEGGGGGGGNKAPAAAVATEASGAAAPNPATRPTIPDITGTQQPSIATKRTPDKAPTVAALGDPRPLGSLPGRMKDHLNAEFGQGQGDWSATANKGGGFSIKDGSGKSVGTVGRREGGIFDPTGNYSGKAFDNVEFTPAPGSQADPAVIKIFRDANLPAATNRPPSPTGDNPTALNVPAERAAAGGVTRSPVVKQIEIAKNGVIRRDMIARRVSTSVEKKGDLKGQRKISFDAGFDANGQQVKVEAHFVGTLRPMTGGRLRSVDLFKRAATDVAENLWTRLRKSPEAVAWAESMVPESALGDARKALMGPLQDKYVADHFVLALKDEWVTAFGTKKSALASMQAFKPGNSWTPIAATVLGATTFVAGVKAGFDFFRTPDQMDRVQDLGGGSDQLRNMMSNTDFMLSNAYQKWHADVVTKNPIAAQYFSKDKPFPPNTNLWGSAAPADQPRQKTALLVLLEKAITAWRNAGKADSDVAQPYRYLALADYMKTADYKAFRNEKNVAPFVEQNGALKPEFYANTSRVNFLNDSLTRYNTLVWSRRVQARSSMTAEMRNQIGDKVRNIEANRVLFGFSGQTDASNAITNEINGSPGWVSAILTGERENYNATQKSATDATARLADEQSRLFSDYQKSAKSGLAALDGRQVAVTNKLSALNPANATSTGSTRRDGIRSQIGLEKERGALIQARLRLINAELLRFETAGAKLPASMVSDRSAARAQLETNATTISNLQTNLGGLQQTQANAQATLDKNLIDARVQSLNQRQTVLRDDITFDRQSLNTAQADLQRLKSLKTSERAGERERVFGKATLFLRGESAQVDVVVIGAKEYLKLGKDSEKAIDKALTPDVISFRPAVDYNAYFDVVTRKAKLVRVPEVAVPPGSIATAENKVKALEAKINAQQAQLNKVLNEIKKINTEAAGALESGTKRLPTSDK